MGPSISGVKVASIMKQRIIAVSGSLFAALTLSGGAAADPSEDGVAHARGGDYATTMRLAEQGSAEARETLGEMYISGKALPRIARLT
jgi:hypothetical protein